MSLWRQGGEEVFGREGEIHRRVYEGLEPLLSPGSPLNRNNAFFEVGHDGRRGVFVLRSVCCQEYRAPGEENREQCPMLSQRELERRAREVLAVSKGVERWL